MRQDAPGAEEPAGRSLPPASAALPRDGLLCEHQEGAGEGHPFPGSGGRRGCCGSSEACWVARRRAPCRASSRELIPKPEKALDAVPSVPEDLAIQHEGRMGWLPAGFCSCVSTQSF